MILTENINILGLFENYFTDGWSQHYDEDTWIDWDKASGTTREVRLNNAFSVFSSDPSATRVLKVKGQWCHTRSQTKQHFLCVQL